MHSVFYVQDGVYNLSLTEVEPSVLYKVIVYEAEIYLCKLLEKGFKIFSQSL